MPTQISEKQACPRRLNVLPKLFVEKKVKIEKLILILIRQSGILNETVSNVSEL